MRESGIAVPSPPTPSPGAEEERIENLIRDASAALQLALDKVTELVQDAMTRERTRILKARSDMNIATRILGGMEHKMEELTASVRQAEAEFATAASTAAQAQETVRRLKDSFIPEDDAEKAMVQKRVDRAEDARQKKEEAASRLDIARYNLDTDHHSLVAELEKDQATASRRVDQAQEVLARLEVETEAVNLVQQIVRLGPARFHHALQLSGHASSVEAALERYVERVDKSKM